LGERRVRNAKVVGSIPSTSTFVSRSGVQVRAGLNPVRTALEG
jgi:hypothetical protein